MPGKHKKTTPPSSIAAVIFGLAVAALVATLIIWALLHGAGS